MKQLDPKAYWLFFFNYITSILISLGTPVFILFVMHFSLKDQPGVRVEAISFFENIFNWFLIAIPVVLILSFIWAKLANYFYRYELTDIGFKKELGVIYKQYVTIPYDRIQNVDIYRGIWARILGLSDLNIQTAGSGTVVITGEGRLPGLSKEVAEALRDELVKRSLDSRRGQGL